MPIKIICPECQATYQLPDQQAGKKVRCKDCRTIFVAAETAPRPTAVRTAPSRISRDAEEVLNVLPIVEQPAAKKSPLPWILGGAGVVIALLLVLCGILIAMLLMPHDHPSQAVDNKKTLTKANDTEPPPIPVIVPKPKAAPSVKPSDNPPIVKPLDNPPVVKPSDNPPIQSKSVVQNEGKKPAVEDAPRTPAASNNGRLSEEDRERVKRATVFLRVKMADGTQVSGSGFFGCKEAPNIVLTNAHVVGMLSPDGARPRDVEVVVNSGEADEWKTKARVLGVDRLSDLALLDIGEAPKQAPEPLPIKPAGGLHPLDEVYVFGFPLGEQLGKEITIRPASVSALRRKHGDLDKVQVNGGMDPGNSGGPVVDNRGAVVGVAVSGYEGRQINFAIPGERVHAILDGRISELAVGQPYFTDNNKVSVPVVMEMIDPRNLIKEVGVDVWVGDKPANPKAEQRPPATTQPQPQTGDTSHTFFPLRYHIPQGSGEISLPDLPPGKVYWHQPRWVNSKGETHWGMASPMPLHLKTSPPVYRKPVNLVLRYNRGAKRMLDLTLDNIFRTSNDEDSEAFRIRTAGKLKETVANTGSDGSILNLRYQFPPSRDLILPDGQSIPNPTLEEVKKDIPRLLVSLVQLDRVGNITQQAVDEGRLSQLKQTDPKLYEAMKDFHQRIQVGLEALSVSLPSSGEVKPLYSWKAEHHFPIDTPGKMQTGTLDATFTYLGTRKRNGREEAVIGVEGPVSGFGDTVSGKANGQIMVDVSNGQTLLAELTVKLQLKTLLAKPGEVPRELRVLATMKFKLQRKL